MEIYLFVPFVPFCLPFWCIFIFICIEPSDCYLALPSCELLLVTELFLKITFLKKLEIKN